jgi:hypothetical protein
MVGIIISHQSIFLQRGVDEHVIALQTIAVDWVALQLPTLLPRRGSGSSIADVDCALLPRQYGKLFSAGQPDWFWNSSDCLDFINVDLIAAGLSPFDPDRAAIRAGRLMTQEIQRRVFAGESFAFSTKGTLHLHCHALNTTIGFQPVFAF